MRTLYCALMPAVMWAVMWAIAPVCPALAQERTDDMWLLTAGTEVDDEDGYRLDLGLTWSPNEATLISALAARADSSTDFNDVSSTLVDLSADHFFDPIGVVGGVRWWSDSDLLDARSFAASVYLKRNGWRVALNAGLRDSEFEPLTFDTIIPVRSGPQIIEVPLSGRADCSLDNSAFGASITHSGTAWTVSAGGMKYEYSESDCDLTNTVLPPEIDGPPGLTRQIFRRIAESALDLTGQLASSQLTRENGFLDSTFNAGLQYQKDARSWGLNYFRDREEFAGLNSDTLMGSFGFSLTDRSDIELRLGATDSDLVGTVAFAGATVYVYLGGGR